MAQELLVAARTRGRPSTYDIAVADAIIARVSETNDSLRKICKDPDMPARRTVDRWFYEHADFRARYEIASRSRAEDLAIECLEIADDADRDYMVEDLGEGVKAVVPNKEHLIRTQVRLGERHRIAASLTPKRWSANSEGAALADAAAPPVPPQPVQAEPPQPGVVTLSPPNPDDHPQWTAIQKFRETLAIERAQKRQHPPETAAK